MTPKKSTRIDLKPNYKLWLEKDGEYIFGPGAFAILSAVHKSGSITKGAENLGMSYRYAWGVIRKIEQKLGVKLIETFKGGSTGGGGAKITEYGLEIMSTYDRINSAFCSAVAKI
jgi:molybdate transport repressor ModE-like protein